MRNMKPILLLLTVAFIIPGCMKSHNDGKLSQVQLNAVEKLKNNYQSAKLYNDSLLYAINGTISSDSAMIHHFDNMYHYYDSQFDSCHSRYEHDYSSADHFHNSGAIEMHDSQNGMMNGCQCCANGGHSADLHKQMATLHELHAHYHPH